MSEEFNYDDVKKARSLVRQKYHVWKQTEKGARESISGANPTQEQRNRARNLLDSEISNLQDFVRLAEELSGFLKKYKGVLEK